MFGDNPIRKPEKGDGSVLQVQEIFATIQGEGPYSGWPAVFVRLGGCNLACDFCDTEFESFVDMSVADIIEQIIKLAVGELIVITGGEPFRQNIVMLCDVLIEKGFKVQIETNGTLYRPVHKDVSIVCSPKNTGKGYAMLREDLLAHLSAMKFVVSDGNKLYRDVAEIGQQKFSIPVYVQPMDEYDKGKNKANLEYAINLAKKNGYRVSLQMHKIMGID